MVLDLRVELYLSKWRCGFLTEWLELRYGRPAHDREELRQAVRQLANAAIDHALVEEFERHRPGRTKLGSSEVF